MRTPLPHHTANGAWLPDAWIIEEEQRREREREEQKRPYLELPLGAPEPASDRSSDANEPQRGVVIIDL